VGIAAVFCIATAVAGASTPSDGLGRWKLDGHGGCYWDPSDSGSNQCDPDNPDGRWKSDGNGGCYWDPDDFGSDQCDPDDTEPEEPWDGDQPSADVCAQTSLAIASEGTFNGTALVLTVSLEGMGSKTDAIKEAFTNWNQYTSRTKVYWDVQDGEDPSADIRVTVNSQVVNDIPAGKYGNTGGCGNAAPKGGGIVFPKDAVDRTSAANLETASTQ
jgi:hypothetical protein